MTTAQRDSLVWKLAGLLRESGDVVLSGCSTLSLLTTTLQQLNHVFELHLGPWGPGQTGFVALPSHPADSPVILQLQFLFDVLQKTLSLKLVHIPGSGLPGPIKIFPFKSLRQLELRGVPLHCLRGLCGIYSQLETLICSRSIQALERLLSALRFLNLSHNRVQDCEGFLMDLSELCHLDISYNHLRLVPRMGPSGAALETLILRGNELRSLQGLEQLRNLRHLDVAYNLLEGHRELAPLWLLAELRQLYLEGNPLWFHPAHRAATFQYLSPRARDATAGFLLDGKVLSLTDFQTSTSSGLGSSAPPLPWSAGSTVETSGGPDLSDSISSGGIVAQHLHRKVKSRVRVRRASISEPSDTDPEPRTLDPSPAGRFVRQHRELELMNSFRERFGCDWLQYRNHLETSGTPVLATSETPALSTLPLSPGSVPGSPPPEKESPQEVAEEVRLLPEPREEVEVEEQDEVEAELCRPMLVCPLEGPEGVRGRECFLRVTSGHLFEVELQAARTLARLELQSLEAAEVEPEPQTEHEAVLEHHPDLLDPLCAQGADPLPGAPVLVLHFSYICPDRQLRRYVVLEPDAHAALQELLAVLTPAATTAQHELGEARDPLWGRLQCLRCGHEFKPEEPRLGLDSEEGWRPLFQKTESPAVCPNCGSDHVVLLARSLGTSHREHRQDEQPPVPSQTASAVRDPPDPSDHSSRADGAPSQAPVSQDRHSWSLSPPPERHGLRSVDHRLRLFLDVEVFADAQEEFQCCLKVPLVLAGHPGESVCLVVVSDRRLYVLKVTGEICGPPASWLQPTLAVPLHDLSGIELGLAGQSLRLEWASGAGSCVLLPRDAKHCRAFLDELTDVLQALPPSWRSSVSATEEEVTPKHRLWPLLERDSSSEPPLFFYLRVFLVEGLATCPVSLLVTLSTLYLLEEDPAGSQAEPALPAAPGEASEMPLPSGLGPSVHVREQWPLSSLSSVLLYRTAPGDLRLVFYDEVSRLESFWALRVVCPEQLTALLAWIREPWEELFSIGLRTVTQETLELDR
ncbi:serine/threonine-protein kinase 11-interacting protein isoform X3 [Callorhinus ursinus]|uniref:Serine/threonine-protein kinase 11-interacting protein n=1 Tax=Callorhinus ursinus TaxID=34884 RepID=A0A3Q7QK18_CALUR|nr:serine/threonine-protein kinase 11-interacting protein isoform X3 [Callorhinus ursinus]